MNLELIKLILQVIIAVLQIALLIIGWLLKRTLDKMEWRIKYLENN